MEEVNLEISRFRKLTGFSKYLTNSILILITVSGIVYILSLLQMFNISFMKQQYAGWFMGLLFASVFLLVPARKRSSMTSIPWYDWIFASFGLIVGMYIVINYEQILYEFGNTTPLRVALSTIAIFLVLETLRRMFGLGLVIIIAIFLLYGFVAPYMPGAFKGQQTSYDQLLNYLYLDTNSLLDLLYLAASMGLAFILFGQVLLVLKGGDIFNNISMRLFGKYRGGPAKASIVGSSAVGSITGGPVANVMLTGSMTIPLMKRSGYTSAQAGAIEAVASTGGSITPPIMGIVAFIIAENLGVPYQVVAIAALVPAVLYYLALFIQVDLKAGQNGIGRIPKEQLPSRQLVLKTGWLMIPVFASLVYYLFIKGLPPETAGVYASGISLLVLLIQKEVREKLLHNIFRIFKETGETMLEIGVILSAAGIIVGIVGITGLGFNLVQVLADFGQYGLLPLLLASAVVCVILGMGMPAVAAYSIVAVLVAPALVELGVEPMAAHLFVFFFATVSNFTPPIALACFAAAPIAKESPHKIGFTSMKLGVVAFIVPFIFVYNPNILLGIPEGVSIVEIIVSNIIVVIGVIVLAIGVAGYFVENLTTLSRSVFILFSIMILLPDLNLGFDMALNILGIVGAATLMFIKYKSVKKTNLSNVNNAIS